MNIWLIFSIALATVVVALILAYVLKSRLSDDDVWEELVPPEPSAQEPQEYSAYSDSRSLGGSKDSYFTRGEPMSASTPALSSRTRRDIDLRRSSRIDQPVSLMVSGTNRRGESFQEKTSAISLNLHGCRYSSRHDYPLEVWVTLQVTGTDAANSASLRARVRSILSAQTPRELCQVGVELETPGNVWGIAAPPEDWQRILGTGKSGASVAVPTASALEPADEILNALFERTPATPERRGEVTVFPGPSTPPSAETSASKEPSVQKTDRVVLTPDQLLQALQGKLQQAADRAVQTAIAAHVGESADLAVQKAITMRLDDSVRGALTKIDDVWKSNLRQTEEFSAARLAEVQNRWDKELVVYRGRAEETARRIETAASNTQQSLAESQKIAERVRGEVEPELYARLNQTFAKASHDFDERAAQVSERHLAALAQSALVAAREARAKLDESVAEIRSLLGTAPAPEVAEEQIASLVESARQLTLNRVEEGFSELSQEFEQRHDVASRRIDELTKRLENFAAVLRESQSQQVQAISEIRTLLSNANQGVPQEVLDSHIHSTREQLHNHLEWRLGEFSGRFEELAQRVSALTTESRDARSAHEQGMAEVRGLVSNATGGVSQERMDWLLNSAREQVLNHFEFRLREFSSRHDQQFDQARQHSEEIGQRLERLALEVRTQFEEGRKPGAERPAREPQLQDSALFEQISERAVKDFETAAARVSDRQLIRLAEQRQAMAREAALELEARASEARALLEKAANGTLDEFRRRLEIQIDLITAETTERVTSALSSLDKESRASIDARRRAVETEVARAAEQSATEFRSGIKAFLYSCLVAAVSAVDQHAQNTLAGLEKDPSSTPLTLEAPVSVSVRPDGLSSAANASSTDHRG